MITALPSRLTLSLFGDSRFVEVSHPLKSPLRVKSQPTRLNPLIYTLIRTQRRTQHTHLSFRVCKNWTFNVPCSQHRMRVPRYHPRMHIPSHRRIYVRMCLWQGPASPIIRPARNQSTRPLIILPPCQPRMSAPSQLQYTKLGTLMKPFHRSVLPSLHVLTLRRKTSLTQRNNPPLVLCILQ